MNLNRKLALVAVTFSTFLLAGCFSTPYPLSFSIAPLPGSSGDGKCVEGRDEISRCYLMLDLKNTSNTPWVGSLRANLISTDGARYLNVDKSQGDLEGFYEILKPSHSEEWFIIFEVDSNKAFNELVLIDERGSKITTLPVKLGFSNWHQN
jgi:hypothetical protein